MIKRALILLFALAIPCKAQIFPANVDDKGVKDNLYYLYEQIQRAINGGLSGAYIPIAAPFGGDVTGTYGATVVGNDSHGHTSSTVPGFLPTAGGTMTGPLVLSTFTVTAGAYSTSIHGGNQTSLINYTLPPSTDSVAGRFLQIDGSGNLSWQDQTIGGEQIFFFSIEASDLTGYYNMYSSYPLTNVSTFSFTATSDNVVVGTYSTLSGYPSSTVIPEGIWEIHLHARKTNIGAKDIAMYGKIYKRSTLGVLTLIGQTETSEFISGVESDFSIHFSTDTLMLTAGDRILAEAYYDVSGGGVDPDVEIYFGGTTYSHLALPAPAVSILDFVPYVGATALLNMGSHDITTTGTSWASYFRGDGSYLTALTPGNISAGTAGIDITGNAATVTDGAYLSVATQTFTGSNTFIPATYADFRVKDYVTFNANGKTGVGYKAGAVSGNYNTAYGAYASSSTTGANNTAVGYLALEDNRTGNSNVAVGYAAGKDRTASSTNIDIGMQAGLNSTSGSYNTNIGYQAGNASSGDYGISLGYNSGHDAVGGHNVYIGENITKPILYGEIGDSYTLNLADVLVADIATGTAAFRGSVSAASFAGDGSALTGLPITSTAAIVSVLDAHTAFVSTATHQIDAYGLFIATAPDAFLVAPASFTLNHVLRTGDTMTGALTATISGASMFAPTSALNGTGYSSSSGFNSGTGLTGTSLGNYYNTGVYGYASGDVSVLGADQIGVSGSATSNTTNVYGVKGVATNSAAGRNAYGVYGSALGAGNRYAGYFDGQVVATSSITTNVGFYGNGANLTGLPITSTATIVSLLGAHTVALSTSAFLPSANIFTAYSNAFQNVTASSITVSGVVSAASFSGSGANLTDLPVGLFEIIDGNLVPRAVAAFDINFEISDGNIRPL